MVITGANTGIGFETAKALATRGATVVLAARNRTKTQNAVARIADADVSTDTMKATLFLKIQAIYLGAIGAISLLIPQAGGSQLGSLTNFDIFVARSLGAVLVTVAALNWVASSAPGPVLRLTLWANVFMNVTLGVVDTIATANATISTSSWTGISVHALFTIGLLFYLLRGLRAAPARGVPAGGQQAGADETP